jgi:hypothetical protein
MKARYWSLAIVLILINYIIFSSLFSRLLEADFDSNYATRTPGPTFTPAPAQPVIIIPTLTPITPIPTPTATRVMDNETANAAPSPAENMQAEADSSAEQSGNEAQLEAPGAVNIRSGPGLNYSVIGALNPNTAVPIVGRNSDASWWQIKISGDKTGWVSNAVVRASSTDNVPLAQASAAPVAAASQPQPASSSPAPSPQKPKYQFEPTGWFDDTNYGLTRFLGDIKDVNGNPVDGVFVQASCGNYSTISYPSGPAGWGQLNESADWPSGFYDITIDSKPVPCIWTLTIVETDDRKTVKARLSESVPVEVTQEKSIITANWRKNW